MAARSIVEKKSVINLLEAYAVSLKHYLRGEDGIYYQDLYYLVKFLPAYAFPPSIPSVAEIVHDPSINQPGVASPATTSSFLYQRSYSSAPTLPLPATSSSPRKTSFLTPIHEHTHKTTNREKTILPRGDEGYLLPSRIPPRYHIIDLFPFSLLVKCLTKRGRELKGKTAAKLRARLRNNTVSHNLPLEISLYLSSYIAALQTRKQVDVPTINGLLTSLNQLVDALTGLERILTTPIPFSYSIHLWVVTMIYCLALPFQIWSSLKWVTIPGTIIVSFMFFGFVVAGEEIENPFGYDKNDLNLDHFTNNIIKNELLAITSAPPPDPARWAFAPENNLLFSNNIDERITPAEWVQRGHIAMQKAMGAS
ncbi:hypothetical protein C0991_003208 [Blastosporella zonata]|nr:hypothetical protein C0991_003208 [Blastosporella zonata]